MKIVIGALITLALAFGAYSLFVMLFTPSLYDFLIAAAAVIAVFFGVKWFRRRRKSVDRVATTSE